MRRQTKDALSLKSLTKQTVFRFRRLKSQIISYTSSWSLDWFKPDAINQLECVMWPMTFATQLCSMSSCSKIWHPPSFGLQPRRQLRSNALSSVTPENMMMRSSFSIISVVRLPRWFLTISCHHQKQTKRRYTKTTITVSRTERW